MTLIWLCEINVYIVYRTLFFWGLNVKQKKLVYILRIILHDVYYTWNPLKNKILIGKLYCLLNQEKYVNACKRIYTWYTELAWVNGI